MAERRAPERLYGRNAVIEALVGRRRIHRLHVADGTERQPRVAAVVSRTRERGVPIQTRPARELEQLVGPVNHQGLVLEVGGYPYVALDHLLDAADQRPLVILDHLQDPQNLGTLMRTAEASGVAGLVIPDRRAASITPAVVNASAGAVEHLLVARVRNIVRAIDVIKQASYWVTALEATETAQPIYQTDVPEPAALIIGAEGRGIAPTTLRVCDLIVELPMLGRINSLNAAVAGSIALFELLRQHMASQKDAE